MSVNIISQFHLAEQQFLFYGSVIKQQENQINPLLPLPSLPGLHRITLTLNAKVLCVKGPF